MFTYVLRYNRKNGKMGKRTVKARDMNEAHCRAMRSAPDGFWFYITERRDKAGKVLMSREFPEWKKIRAK